MIKEHQEHAKMFVLMDILEIHQQAIVLINVHQIIIFNWKIEILILYAPQDVRLVMLLML